jgi:hypothetical protein
LALVRDGAKRAGVSASDYGRERLLAAMLAEDEPLASERLRALLQEREEKEARDTATLAKLESFHRLFCEAMELNLAGKLTVARFRGLVERRSA